MVNKISSDIYKSDSREEAIEEAKKLSKLEEDLFSVIKSQGDFYIERGDPFIRISEELIGIYRNGKESKR